MNAVAVAARHSHGQGWNLHPHPPPTVTKRYYTLATLEGIAWIDDIVVPLEPDYIERMTTNATAWGFVKTRFIAGGSTRHRAATSTSL